eukprot:13347015-Alexandrium_andersonii.AAC.1
MDAACPAAKRAKQVSAQRGLQHCQGSARATPNPPRRSWSPGTVESGATTIVGWPMMPPPQMKNDFGRTLWPTPGSWATGQPGQCQ